MGHIELARWADRILVAPATADFMARLAHGLADDLLTTLCLATDAPLSRRAGDEPADVGECRHPGQRRAAARSAASTILGPARASQACGETGAGRMLEPGKSSRPCLRHRAPKRRSAARAQGRCHRRTDARARSIRCVSSPIAAPARWVMRWPRPRAMPAPTSCWSAARSTCRHRRASKRVDVETAEQMLTAVQAEMADTDIFIAAAAVSDYRPRSRRRAEDQENQRRR